jgi:6-phosphogluconolactonase (cycloisomerase 2 family)
MRMKFNKSGQLILVSAAALLLSGLISACLVTNTADFIFVASSKAAGPNNYGFIDVMEVNAESGTLRQIPTSPFPSQGRNPVAEAVSPDGNYLYVVNQDDNTIVQFQIGSDGKLYAQSTINTPGIAPVALAVDPAQGYLYVIDTYQPIPTCSPADPCAGSVAVFNILPGTPGSISSSPLAASGGACYNAPSGAPCPVIQNPSTGLNYYPLSIGSDIVTPQGINLLQNGSNLYITAQDSTSGKGYIFNFTASSGVLTAVAAQPRIQTGTKPTAITSAGSTLFVADSVYLADAPAGNILVYTANGDGSLSGSGAYPAGNTPVALALNPAGTYLFAANETDANVSTFTVNGTTLNNIGSNATGTQPSAVLVDPNLGQFIYVTNYLGSNGVGTVSGFALNPSSGGLTNAVNSPFTSNAQPTAMAAIKHKF